jgi:hypothetical protein
MQELEGSPFPRIKTCKSCRETIHFDAVKCPKCQAFQVWWKNPQYISLLFIPLPLLFFFFIPNSPFREKPKFENFRSKISVTDSQFFFSRDNGNVEITSLVKIKNDSPHKWEHPTIEVQYFNADGKLIDTQSDKDFSSVLVPGTEQAFRFRTKPAKPETEYASQKIFIRSAEAPIFSD